MVAAAAATWLAIAAYAPALRPPSSSARGGAPNRRLYSRLKWDGLS